MDARTQRTPFNAADKNDFFLYLNILRPVHILQFYLVAIVISQWPSSAVQRAASTICFKS